MDLLLDIGGTNIRIAATSDSRTFSNPQIIPTPKDFTQAITAISQTAQIITQGQKARFLVGGVKSLNAQKNALRDQPNFPLWVNKPLKSELERALGVKVFLENDAAMGGLGEAVYGAGKNYPILAYMTISTGVGGVKIVNGKIGENAFGFEPGLQVIGEQNYLENYIAGSEIAKKYKLPAEQIKDTRVWDEIARWLAIGLNNILVAWSPHGVVLGGSVMKSIPIENVNFYLKEFFKVVPLPPVKLASLGDQSGLYGALVYLRNLLHSGNSGTLQSAS